MPTLHLPRRLLLTFVLAALTIGLLAPLTPTGRAHATCEWVSDFHTDELLLVCGDGDGGYDVYDNEFFEALFSVLWYSFGAG